MDIIIRPYTFKDFTSVYDAVCESLPELIPWMPWCHENYTIEESRTWLESQVPAFRQDKAYEFAIVSASGFYLGGCGLNQLDPINRRANLGYWVRTSATRRGVASAAVRQLLDWGLEFTDLIRFEITIAADNDASRRVAEKTGAYFEGILRNRLLLRGVAHDAAIYSFIR